MKREARIYSNAWVRLMRDRRPQQPLAFSPPSTMVGYLLGWDSPLTSATLLDNPYRASTHVLLNQARARGLYTSLALLAWRAENNGFPSSLAELDKGEVSPPSGERWGEMGMVYGLEGERASLKVPLAPGIVAQTKLGDNSAYQGSGWVKAEPDGLIFRL